MAKASFGAVRRQSVVGGLFVAGMALPLSSVAFAQTAAPTVYNAIDAETLTNIVKAEGSAQVTLDGTDPQGPVLKVQMAGGLNYSVIMDDCDGGKPNLCKSFGFHAVLPPGAINFSQINSFNENMRYATAYLTDKGVPRLRMDESLRGGVTRDFVAYSVRIFVKLVSGYVQQAK